MSNVAQPPSSSSLFHISSVHHGGCSGHIRVNICTPLSYGYALYVSLWIMWLSAKFL